MPAMLQQPLQSLHHAFLNCTECGGPLVCKRHECVSEHVHNLEAAPLEQTFE